MRSRQHAREEQGRQEERALVALASALEERVQDDRVQQCEGDLRDAMYVWLCYRLSEPSR